MSLDRVKTILTGRRGESLMESIASILIFTVLMTAVAMMIRTSLRMTQISTSNAASRQEEANAAVLEDYTSPTAATSDKDLVLEQTGGGINVTIEITFYDDGTFRAFTPKP